MSTRAPLAPPAAPPRYAGRVHLLDTENAFRLAPWIAELEATGERVIRCNLGEPDFPIPDHVREEVKRRLDEGATHYSDPQGLPALRRAVAEEVSATRGIEVTPDRVVVFPGAKPPIGFAQQVYCEGGDEVVYPSPGFPIYESFTRYVGATPVPLHLREEAGFALTADDLAPLVGPRTRLLYLNSPANPTGGVSTAAQLEEIAGVFLRQAPPEARVYSDEVYEKIVFDRNAHASIAGVPGMAERTILVSGVSKGYAWTGGRLGWAVFPTAEEAAVFTNLNVNYFSCLPAYNQWGAVAALRSPESGPAVARMVAAFQERRDQVVRALNAIDGVTCPLPGGAFYVFPNVAGACARVGAVEAWEALPAADRERTSPATLLQRFLLFRWRVATMDRRSFGKIGSEGKHFLRISIATGMDDLREAVRRIAAALEDRAGFARFVAAEDRLY